MKAIITSLNFTEDKTTVRLWELGKQVLFLFDSSYIQLQGLIAC